jgi:hypothetical protein
MEMKEFCGNENIHGRSEKMSKISLYTISIFCKYVQLGSLYLILTSSKVIVIETFTYTHTHSGKRVKHFCLISATYNVY